MGRSVREDCERLLAHWDEAFRMSEEEKARCAADLSPEEDWKKMAPSPKLLAAALALADRQNVLDYGSGNGWGGIVLAKSGCPQVTCADVAPNAKDTVEFYAGQFGVGRQIRAICIDENWLAGQPDAAYDGLICSNVLDVVPPETAEEILRQFPRVLAPDSPAIIGLNFYMPPEAAAARGLAFEDENKLYIDGVLRMVNRTDEEWTAMLERCFAVERIERFAWPGEPVEKRRLFILRKK